MLVLCPEKSSFGGGQELSGASLAIVSEITAFWQRERKKTVLGPILEAKMATKINKKPFRSAFQNGGDFWTSFKSHFVQARRNARSPGETTEGVCRKLEMGQSLDVKGI